MRSPTQSSCSKTRTTAGRMDTTWNTIIQAQRATTHYRGTNSTQRRTTQWVATPRRITSTSCQVKQENKVSPITSQHQARGTSAEQEPQESQVVAADGADAVAVAADAEVAAAGDSNSSNGHSSNSSGSSSSSQLGSSNNGGRMDGMATTGGTAICFDD